MWEEHAGFLASLERQPSIGCLEEKRNGWNEFTENDSLVSNEKGEFEK